MSLNYDVTCFGIAVISLPFSYKIFVMSLVRHRIDRSSEAFWEYLKSADVRDRCSSQLDSLGQRRLARWRLKVPWISAFFVYLFCEVTHQFFE